MRLDDFFSAAGRLSRRIPIHTDGKKVEQLLREAPPLLGQHPDRALEIALSVQRLKPGGEVGNTTAALYLRFAAEFAKSACERLPAPGEAPPSRAQAHEALLSYVALHDLGASSALRRGGAPAVSSAVVAGAGLLETSALVAGLGKVSTDGEAEVILALQRSLGDDVRLAALSPSDLIAALAGIARASDISPEAATQVLRALGGCLPTLAPSSLCDACRAVAQLGVRAAGDLEAATEEFLVKAWPQLAAAVKAALPDDEEHPEAHSRFVTAMPLLVGLARLVTSLPIGRETSGKRASEAFVEQVLQPHAPNLLKMARQDSEAYELSVPLLHAAGGTSWASFLAHLALEGLQRLPQEPAGTERAIALTEVVASTSEGRAAFPPFFDFALEEILRRLPDLQQNPRMLQQVVRIFSQVHLERPDFLGPAVPLLVSAASHVEDAEASDLSLRLSRFAALYARVVVDLDVLGTNAQAPAISGLQAALVSICSVFEVCGSALQELLSVETAVRQGSREDGEQLRASCDAMCLALSAFTQVASRQSSIGSSSAAAGLTPARQQLLARGSELLEASAAAWQRYGLQLSAPQTHIFVAAFRMLCMGPGLPPPQPATLAALEGQRRALLERAMVGEREARLCLAVFEELGRDPACPEALRATLGGATSSSADASAEGSTSDNASSRLRQHMQATAAPSGAAWAQGPRSGGSGHAAGTDRLGLRSFLHRWLGL
jgi:hypothetical protein